MKKIFLYFSLFPILTWAQVGINTNNPRTTLEINVEDANNPSSTDGIVIPRVTSLNMIDQKPKGLLVFLDHENENTETIEKGFYWWNGTQWIPFFSMNKLTKDKTITYVSSKDNFKGGNITGNNIISKFVEFEANTLLANDVDNFEINAAGELVVKKAGTYHLQAIISLHYEATDNRRDAFEGKILVNGIEPLAPNPKLQTSYGFPSSGASFTFDNSFSIMGFLELKANDRISLQINRYYPDSPGTAFIRPNGKQTNLTLRFMGEI